MMDRSTFSPRGPPESTPYWVQFFMLVARRLQGDELKSATMNTSSFPPRDPFISSTTKPKLMHLGLGLPPLDPCEELEYIARSHVA